MSLLLLLWKHAEIKSRLTKNTSKIMQDTVFSQIHFMDLQLITWHSVICRGRQSCAAVQLQTCHVSHSMTRSSLPTQRLCNGSMSPHPTLEVQEMSSKGPLETAIAPWLFTKSKSNKVKVYFWLRPYATTSKITYNTKNALITSLIVSRLKQFISVSLLMQMIYQDSKEKRLHNFSHY